MATFYWPGDEIHPGSSPRTWDSTDWDAIPGTPAGYNPDFALDHGYDPHRPGESPSNHNHDGAGLLGGNYATGTPFHLTGEDREVEFFVAGDAVHGIFMTLVQPGSTTYHAPPAGGAPYYLPGIVVQYNTGSPAGPPYPRSAAFSVFLTAGEEYFLWISSAVQSGASASPYASGYGQAFTLYVNYAPALNNDFRNDALDVAISSSGSTYASPAVLNYRFSQSGAGATDDATSEYYATGWWRYRPIAACDFTVKAVVGPTGYRYPALAAYRMSATTGALSLIQASTTPAEVIGGHASAGETIYFVVGILSGFVPAQTYTLYVTGGKSINPSPDPTPPLYIAPIPPMTWPAIDTDPPDPYKPDKSADTVDVSSSTLLDLVRAFSASVGRAVRITGPTRIEMVDPLAVLPSTDPVATSTANSLYSATTRSAAAIAQVLSVKAGDVTLSGSANLISDDMRLVKSSWRIPDRLPVLGLPPAAVQRLTYTFSPTGFQASVEFHFPAVPIGARRI